MKKLIIIFIITIISEPIISQENSFEKLHFLIGNWSGTGQGFGNEKSKIKSSFQYDMNGKYIEVINDSKFEPTEKNPAGEHHIDKGFISYDNDRHLIMFRQFNIEGYVNEYFLNEAFSNDSIIFFESENIENLKGGKARWIIKKISDSEFESKFEVSFPGKDYMCLGTNNLKKNK